MRPRRARSEPETLNNGTHGHEWHPVRVDDQVMVGEHGEQVTREDDAKRENAEEDEAPEARRMMEEDETPDAWRMMKEDETLQAGRIMEKDETPEARHMKRARSSIMVPILRVT